VFFNEIMTGWYKGYSAISEVLFATLEDTGWYSANYSIAEPLAWGDYQSIIGAAQADFKNFSYAPPALAWPRHYVPRTEGELNSMDCTFDHQAESEPAEELQFARYRGMHSFRALRNYSARLYTRVGADYICKFTKYSRFDEEYGGHHGTDTMWAVTTMAKGNHYKE
jgi:hypothetical protein